MNVSKEYLDKIIKNKVRVDGRKFDEYREVSIENDVSKHAEGSARVKIGDTEVIVGVKLEVGEPFPDKPDQGTIIVGAELLPLSNPDFESGPPSVESIELARVVDRGLRESEVIDFKKLCISEGEKVWLVLIDIYIINDAGNLQDAAALGAIAALKDAKMLSYDGKKVDYSKRKGGLPLTCLPVEVTMIKIGDVILVDPCLEEERFADARLTVATTEKSIVAMQKGADSTIKVKDVKEMIKIAIDKGKELRKVLK